MTDFGVAWGKVIAVCSRRLALNRRMMSEHINLLHNLSHSGN